MRKSLPAWLALALALGLPALAQAQIPKVKITGVRAGFTGGVSADGQRKSSRLKTGLWAPVYIDVQVGNERLGSGEYDLVVETTDSDDLQNVYVERRFLPTMEPKESAMLLSYVRVGGSNSDVKVTVRSRYDGRTLSEMVLKANKGDYAPLDSSRYVYLTLGGPLMGLKKALAQRANNPLNKELGDDDLEPEENWVRRFAVADAVELLPTSWFGYQAADAVILATGSDKFVADLNRDNDDQVKARLDALAEWVRRGGRLIITVAHNHQHVNAVLEKLKVIDVQVKGELPNLKALNGLTRWAGPGSEAYRARPAPDKPGELPDLEVANLVAGKGVHVLAGVNNVPANKDESPLLLYAPCGLGRVIVLGVDVDQAPFVTWKGQRLFWEAMRREVEPANLDNLDNPNQQQMRGAWGQQGQQLASRLVDGLELFPDVPVISFGWVALFIVIYILIVGPLDYFFLKKVVKRLELTWITFPAVVIVISVVAYAAAYKLKGNDLRINKVDVVDIDLHGNHAYGTTWFTLFSPRIQNYTIGIEPNMPAWGKEPDVKNAAGGKSRPEDWAKERYAPLVGWMGRPENLYGGGRGGSGGLFRRTYDYAPEASGLQGVPIQVWSTKTFGASYDHPIGAGELIEAELKFTKAQQNKVGGKITSHLPVDLQDVVLFYAGSAYSLDKLTAGQPVIVDQKNLVVAGQGDVALQSWFAGGYPKQQQALTQARQRPMNAGGQSAQPPGTFIKSILFHGHPNDQQTAQTQNSDLRMLDQRWRLDGKNRDEVILVGRVAPADGSAEQVNESEATPSRLWLGSLPGGGKREPLVGTLSQETYVRVFIPVAPQ